MPVIFYRVLRKPLYQSAPSHPTLLPLPALHKKTNKYRFTLRMATEMFAETLDESQYSTPLIATGKPKFCIA
jgi:hypothetical protein